MHVRSRHIIYGLYGLMLRSLRSMAEKSFEWAKTRGLWRQNAVHGEEEARLVTDEVFKAGSEQGWMAEQSGAMDLPDP